MAEIDSLTVKVTAEGVKKTAEELNALAEKAGKAEVAVGKTGQKMSEADKQAQKLAEQTQKLAEKFKLQAASVGKSADEIAILKLEQSGATKAQVDAAKAALEYKRETISAAKATKEAAAAATKAEASALAARKKAEEQAQSISKKAQKEAADLKVKTDNLVGALEFEARAAGMTADEIKMMKLESRGASKEQIKAAQAAIDYKNSLKQVGNQAGKTAGQTEKSAAAAKELRGGFRAMRGSTQQVSYQLQDIAVQAQMGTSAFTILGQQGPQLASVFGPGGAVVGAFIAFGAMIGATVVASLQGAEGGVEELAGALERLDRQLLDTEKGTLELSKKFADLGKISAAAAAAEMIAALSDARRAVRSTKLEISQLVDNIGYVDFGYIGDELERLKKRGIGVDDILPMGDTLANEAGGINAAIREIDQAFGIGKKNALEFAVAAASLDSTDLSTYTNLRAVVDNIAASQRELNLPMAEFRRDLVTQETQLRGLTEQTQFLSQARRDLNREGVGALEPLREGAEEDREEAAMQAAREAKALLRRQQAEAKKLAALKKSAQDELAVLRIAGMDKLAAIDAQAQLEIDKKADQRDADLISLQEFEEAKTLIESIASQKRSELELRRANELEAAKQQIQQMALSRASAVAGQFAGVMSQAYGEQSAAAKAAFLLQQGLAMAQIVVATQQAAALAGAYAAGAGPLAWLASVQGIQAMGAAQLAIVAGQTVAGLARATGGQVRGGESYLVGERGPELLTMGGSGRISSNDQLKNAIGGGEGITIVNNVDARGADASVDVKIRKAMQQTAATTIETIRDLSRRRRFI